MKLVEAIERGGQALFAFHGPTEFAESVAGAGEDGHFETAKAVVVVDLGNMGEGVVVNGQRSLGIGGTENRAEEHAGIG